MMQVILDSNVFVSAKFYATISPIMILVRSATHATYPVGSISGISSEPPRNAPAARCL